MWLDSFRLCFPKSFRRSIGIEKAPRKKFKKNAIRSMITNREVPPTRQTYFFYVRMTNVLIVQIHKRTPPPFLLLLGTCSNVTLKRSSREMIASITISAAGVFEHNDEDPYAGYHHQSELLIFPSLLVFSTRLSAGIIRGYRCIRRSCTMLQLSCCRRKTQ